MSDEQTPFEGWAILELMGHRRLAGYVREEQVAGAGFLRLDVPGPDAEQPPVATQLYAPAAVYCITPTSEETARRVAAGSRPEPVSRWELPPAEHVPAGVTHGAGDDTVREDDGEDIPF